MSILRVHCSISMKKAMLGADVDKGAQVTRLARCGGVGFGLTRFYLFIYLFSFAGTGV
jgi:hypothetical protein